MESQAPGERVLQRVTREALGIGRLFDEMRDAVIVADLGRGLIVQWNPAAAELFGYTEEEAIGMPLETLVPDELREQHRNGVRRYAESRRGELVDLHRPVELPAIKKGGERTHVELQFAPVAEDIDGSVYMVAFLRDIDERVQLHHERDLLNKRFRLLLESTGEGLFGLDADGRCIFINLAAADMLGYRPSDLQGKPMHDLIHHSHEDGSPYPSEECPIRRTLTTARPARVGDEVFWHKDGTMLPVQYSASPIAEDGRIAGVVVSFSDVTKRRRLEEALRRSNVQLQLAYDKEREAAQQLRTLDALKNEFVAMVAHDLRSPMTVIAGLAETMRARWDRLEDERKIQFLELISQNINNLSSLVEDVLQVARIESDEFSYEIRSFDVGALVARTVTDFTTAEPNRTLVVEVGEGLPRALGDEQRTWQVLQNLISNALKFSEDDAPVEVAVVHDDADVLRVSITDHGMGIRPEEIGKLFQKFGRVSQTGARAVKGTGLGLYICKRMVEDQGGEITVDSVLGEGSTFSFTLPVPGEGA